MSQSILLHNGVVHLMDGSTQTAEAIAIRDGCIERVGTTAEVREGFRSPDMAIDLGGRAVLPSFVDNLSILAHEIGARVFLDLSDLLNVPEVYALIEQASRRTEPNEWIIGYGWNKSHWGWQRFPHRADLDLVSPHHPVFLLSSDSRIAWLNSKALEQIGIRRDTANPPGGEIERNSTIGAATGILKERAVDLVRPFLPKPEPSVVENALREVVHYYHSVGVTAACTLAQQGDASLLAQLGRPLDLDFDLTIHPHSGDREICSQLGWKTGTQVYGFSIGALWAAVDGTLLSQTAWMLEPYVVDWDQYGIQTTTREELLDLAQWCRGNGWNLLLQASGDAACRQVVDVIQQSGFDASDQTVLIAGGNLISEEDMRRIPRKNVGLCCNPSKRITEHEAGKTYWGSRWERAYRLKDWKEAGTALLFGSMEPLGGWSPLEALDVVTDPHRGEMGLSLEEGISALSRRFAISSSSNREKGRLTCGASADLVVLSGDPAKISNQDHSSLKVDMTFYEGKLVYQREES